MGEEFDISKNGSKMYNLAKATNDLMDIANKFAEALKIDEYKKDADDAKAAYETAQAALKVAEDALKADETNVALQEAKNQAEATAAQALQVYEAAQLLYGTVFGYGTADALLTEIYEKSDECIDLSREMIALYDACVEGFALLEKENAFTANIRQSLEKILTDNKDNYDMLTGTETTTPVEPSIEEHVIVIANQAFAAYKEEYKDVVDEDGSVNGKVEYVYVTEEKKEEENKTDVKVEDKFNKYESDSNKIVYMEYVNSENGNVTAFILNFNNYAVSVTADNGVTYTIEAYGYVVLKPTNA